MNGDGGPPSASSSRSFALSHQPTFPSKQQQQQHFMNGHGNNNHNAYQALNTGPASAPLSASSPMSGGDPTPGPSSAGPIGPSTSIPLSSSSSSSSYIKHSNAGLNGNNGKGGGSNAGSGQEVEQHHHHQQAGSPSAQLLANGMTQYPSVTFSGVSSASPSTSQGQSYHHPQQLSHATAGGAPGQGGAGSATMVTQTGLLNNNMHAASFMPRTASPLSYNSQYHHYSLSPSHNAGSSNNDNNNQNNAATYMASSSQPQIQQQQPLNNGQTSASASGSGSTSKLTGAMIAAQAGSGQTSGSTLLTGGLSTSVSDTAEEDLRPSATTSRAAMEVIHSTTAGPSISSSSSTQPYPPNQQQQRQAQHTNAFPNTSPSHQNLPKMAPAGISFADKVELFSSVAVADHRHLFHAYIYDYLYRQGYERTARSFLQDAPGFPTKRIRNSKRKGKQRATDDSDANDHATSSNTGDIRANKRKRSANEEDSLFDLDDEDEDEEEDEGEDGQRLDGNDKESRTDNMQQTKRSGGKDVRPKKRTMTGASSATYIGTDDGYSGETSNNVSSSTGLAASTGATKGEGKSGTSSSEDSGSVGSSSRFYTMGASSGKDSSSNASNSTQATSISNATSGDGAQSLSLESQAATKGSDGGMTADDTMHSTNSPLGSRDNLFSPELSPSTTQHPSSPAAADKEEENQSSQQQRSTREREASGKTVVADTEESQGDMVHEGEELLPLPDIQIDSNWGFLFEWWEVFWDVWRAKGAKGSGSLAAKAYERTLNGYVSSMLC